MPASDVAQLLALSLFIFGIVWAASVGKWGTAALATATLLGGVSILRDDGGRR